MFPSLFILSSFEDTRALADISFFRRRFAEIPYYIQGQRSFNLKTRQREEGMGWEGGRHSASGGPRSGKTLLASLMPLSSFLESSIVVVLELATRQSWVLNVNRLTRTLTSETSWKREKRASAG